MFSCIYLLHMCAPMCYGIRVVLRGLAGVGLYVHCAGSRDRAQGYQAWQQAPCPAEPPHHPCVGSWELQNCSQAFTEDICGHLLRSF